jgi:hypothetical protein
MDIFNNTSDSANNSVAAKKVKSGLGNIDWKAMLTSILSFTIQLFILFVIGSRVLLACKYAQTSFMPTSGECMPYEKDEPHFHTKEPILNIDKIRIFDKKHGKTMTYSKRILFPFTEITTSHFIIDHLRKTTEDYDISGLRMFCVETIKTIFSWHFSMLSGLLNLMNMSPFETLIIVIGPLILRYYISAAFIIGMIITFFACVVNMSWLFKENVNNTFDEEGKPNTKVDTCGGPKWGNIPMMETFEGFFGVMCNMMGGWIFMWVILLIPIHFLIFIICLVRPFMQTPVIVGSKDKTDPTSQDRDYDLMESVKGLFDTKLDPFMFIVCLNIINTMNVYVNSTAAGAVSVACAAFMIWMVMKKKDAPPYSGPFYINEDVNIKTCNPVCKPGAIVTRPPSSGAGSCGLDDTGGAGAGAGAGADGGADGGTGDSGAGPDLPPIQYQPVGSAGHSPAPGPGTGTGPGTPPAATTDPKHGTIPEGAHPTPLAHPDIKAAAPPKQHGGTGVSNKSIPKIKQTMIDKKMKLLKSTLKHMKKQ